MKASQFSSEQIIRILEQAERGEQTISVICREHHICAASPPTPSTSLSLQPPPSDELRDAA